MSKNNWWKNPVLRGEENDYGDYDYMIEKIPKDKEYWGFIPHICDDCGENTHFHLTQLVYFHTYDGYDYMDYHICWKCFIKERIQCFKNIIKTKFEEKRQKFFGCTKLGWKLCGYLARKEMELEKKGKRSKILSTLVGWSLPF